MSGYFKVVLLCASLVVALSGCPVGVDRTMLIIHGAVQAEGTAGDCAPVVPENSSGYLNKGRLELAVGQTTAEYNLSVHMTYPFTDAPMTTNQMFPNYGKVTTANNLSVRETEFLIESEEEYSARLSSDTEFDWDTISQTQEPFSVPMAYTSPTSTGEFLGTVELPLTDLVVPPIVGDKTTLMIHLVIRAQTLDGDNVESSVLHFPLDICNGCLSNITCPNGTVATPVTETPCFIGQDDPLIQCLVDGAAGG